MILKCQLTKYRNDRKMTQDDLAEMMGVSRQTISKWELGTSVPSIENLIELSDILEISLDELLRSRLNFPIPFDFGKPYSSKSLIIRLIAMALVVVILSSAIFLDPEITTGETVMMILFMIFSAYPILFVSTRDYNSFYDYFTITTTGLKVPKDTVQTKVFHPLRVLRGITGQRDLVYLKWSDIESITIFFDNKGYKPKKETSVSFRPRHIALMREVFELDILSIEGKHYKASLDELFYRTSDESKYFSAIVDYMERKGVLIKDPYDIREAFEKDYSLINAAYESKISNY